ncbi:hypothetical protein [Rhodocyclus gracilis]|nr:hypothetical protein [Rhodocyclus gracilis]
MAFAINRSSRREKISSSPNPLLPRRFFFVSLRTLGVARFTEPLMQMSEHFEKQPDLFAVELADECRLELDPHLILAAAGEALRLAGTSRAAAAAGWLFSPTAAKAGEEFCGVDVDVVYRAAGFSDVESARQKIAEHFFFRLRRMPVAVLESILADWRRVGRSAPEAIESAAFAARQRAAS